MEFLGLFANFGMWIVAKVVPFLFLLTVIVFFHELGHFMVARWFGVGVKVFSIGFGPELFGFNDRHKTRWKISAIPLGGYVKFLGDETEAGGTDREALESMSALERNSAFANKSVGARAAIVAAGPLANFILAIAIFTAMFSIYGQQVTEARVDAVIEGSAAERAGFQPGDLVLSIDGDEIGSFSDLQRIVSVSAETELKVVVDRGGERVPLTATPEREEIEDRFGNKQRLGRLGISRSTTANTVVTERYSVPEAAMLALARTWFIIEQTGVSLSAIVVGRESTDQLGGPIRIAQMSAQIATLGIAPLLNLVAFLSISIGLINLFPIPVLDGGHLVFYALEGVRGRPLSDRFQEIGFRIGFAGLAMLMIFTVWNDIVRLME